MRMTSIDDGELASILHQMYSNFTEEVESSMDEGLKDIYKSFFRKAKRRPKERELIANKDGVSDLLA